MTSESVTSHRVEPPLLDLHRLEALSQAESLVGAGMRYIVRLAYGDELYWPVRVERPDGSRISVNKDAVELAVARIEVVFEQLGAEIGQALQSPPDVARKKYKVLSQRDRDEPEPDYKFVRHSKSGEARGTEKDA